MRFLTRFRSFATRSSGPDRGLLRSGRHFPFGRSNVARAV